jgi:hypothetical protein
LHLPTLLSSLLWLSSSSRLLSFPGFNSFVCCPASVDLVGCSDQIIHVCVIMLDTNTCFNASIIYRDNTPSKKEAWWTDIVRCSDSWESTPWILICDFNVICSIYEKRGSTILWLAWQNDLNKCLIQSCFEDLLFTVSMFT